MLSYTALYGLFVLTSLILTNSFILLARYARQIQSPPSDQDFDRLMKEKESLEVQNAQDQRAIVNLKSTIQQLEGDLKKWEEKSNSSPSLSAPTPSPS